MTEERSTKRSGRQRQVVSPPTGRRIRLRLATLMADKQKRENRIISPAYVIRGSGASKNIVYRGLKEELKEIPFDEWLKLADYFQVPICDLFEVVEE